MTKFLGYQECNFVRQGFVKADSCQRGGWYVVINPVSEGDRLYTSESDVYRRQILTYKVNQRAEIITNIIYNGRRPIT